MDKDIHPIVGKEYQTSGAMPIEAAATYGRLNWRHWRSDIRARLGGLLNRMGVPGAIQPFEVHDGVTGQHIKVTVSSRFTVIQVNGRDYYFYRLTGRFDGTGMGCG